MLSERLQQAVVVWAPAKVNLFLEVLGKRPDGYHEIATLMTAVNLYDTLVFEESDSGDVQLFCDLPELSTGPDNLIHRAARLLRQRTGSSRCARIRLAKRIPIAAGLAGGSTDAAATLWGLNLLWDLKLSQEQLAELAAELGSDIPFFFAGPAAWSTGRGEKITPVSPVRSLWFVLIRPSFGLSTAEVYRGVRIPPEPRSGDAIREAFAAGRIDELGQELHNRLQPAALEIRPELEEIPRRLALLGCAGQAMSGSGSCWFALCHDHNEALRIAREFRMASPMGMEEFRVFIVRSCL